MYNVMIVEDDPMARRLLEIMVTSDDSYHLAVSVESASVANAECFYYRVFKQKISPTCQVGERATLSAPLR